MFVAMVGFRTERRQVSCQLPDSSALTWCVVGAYHVCGAVQILSELGTPQLPDSWGSWFPGLLTGTQLAWEPRESRCLSSPPAGLKRRQEAGIPGLRTMAEPGPTELGSQHVLAPLQPSRQATEDAGLPRQPREVAVQPVTQLLSSCLFNACCELTWWFNLVSSGHISTE